jgi:FixJ family two-component response regulator
MDRTRQQNRPSLTERDKTVLRFIFQGLTNKDIGARLEISGSAANLRYASSSRNWECEPGRSSLESRWSGTAISSDFVLQPTTRSDAPTAMRDPMN